MILTEWIFGSTLDDQVHRTRLSSMGGSNRSCIPPNLFVHSFSDFIPSHPPTPLRFCFSFLVTRTSLIFKCISTISIIKPFYVVISAFTNIGHIYDEKKRGKFVKECRLKDPHSTNLIPTRIVVMDSITYVLSLVLFL